MKSIILIALCIALAAPATLAQQPVDSAEITWKMATLAPKGIGWARHIKAFVFPFVAKATEGNLHIKVYWGGVMGDDEQVVDRMDTGFLQGAGLTAQGATLVCPELAVVSLPFLFQGYDEVDHIKDQMWSEFDEYAKNKGFVLLSWNDQDFDQVYSVPFPVDTPARFEQARFLAWNGPIEQAVLEKLGATVVLGDVPDLGTLVREDRADAAIGPAIYVVGAQLQGVVKYVNPMKIRYSPAIIVSTLSAWKALPKKYRDAILAGRKKLTNDLCARLRTDNEQALAAMLEYGVAEVTTSPADLSVMERKTRPVWDEFAGDLYPQSLLDELVGHLKEFRARQGR